jgi:hypothetical protein
MPILLLLALGLAALALTGRLKRANMRWVGGAAGAFLAFELLIRGQWLGAAMVTAATSWWVWREGLTARVAAMPMDEAEARAVLGVGPNASRDEVIAAHRRLITTVHPDRGGSADLARRVNAARDKLLKGRR